MSAEPRRNDPAWVIGAVVVVVILAVAAAYVLSRGESGQDVTVVPPSATPTETPGPSETPPASETAPPTDAPSETEPAVTEAPTTEAAATEPAGEATDEDAAAFADDNAPAQRTAVGDIDGDGVDEVVVAGVRNNAVRIAVGRWDGSAYRRIFRDDGGPAQRIAELQVGDVNGEARAEIVTHQRAGSEGRSLSVWGVDGGDISRLEGHGGCWDGFHTFGISGVTLEPGRITATCDGSPEPPDAWASDVYEWRKRGWVYTRTQEPGT